MCGPSERLHSNKVLLERQLTGMMCTFMDLNSIHMLTNVEVNIFQTCVCMSLSRLVETSDGNSQAESCQQ